MYQPEQNSALADLHLLLEQFRIDTKYSTWKKNIQIFKQQEREQLGQGANGLEYTANHWYWAPMAEQCSQHTAARPTFKQAHNLLYQSLS